jgi:uncharacterized membrane protein YphA (DoxX/SURF4 family)
MAHSWSLDTAGILMATVLVGHGSEKIRTMLAKGMTNLLGKAGRSCLQSLFGQKGWLVSLAVLCCACNARRNLSGLPYRQALMHLVHRVAAQG